MLPAGVPIEPSSQPVALVTRTAASVLTWRQLLSVFLCGTFAFLDLYCTQPMLPMLSHVFGVTETQVGITISASTVGVAISAALLALFGERLPRKKTIVVSMLALALCTLLTSVAPGLKALAVGRFFQGLATPGVFILTIAYVTEEWPAALVPRVMSAYVAGTVFGGFCGRFFGGILAEHFGWHAVFLVLGAGGLLGAAFTAYLLAPSRNPSQARPAAISAAGPLAPILANLRNPRLLATFLVGFCMLFTLIATFDFITFYLSAPPFLLSTTGLSSLFAVYLIGLFATLAVGTVLGRIGLRHGMVAAASCSLLGVLLTLVPSLWVVALGLAFASSGIFIAQTCCNSFLRDAAPAGHRVAAAGMYICCYYIGGTVGGLLPGPLYRVAGWPGCVALIALALVTAAVTARFGWRERPADPIML